MTRNGNNRQGRYGELLAVNQETPGPPVAISAKENDNKPARATGEEESCRELLRDGFHQLGQLGDSSSDDDPSSDGESGILFGPMSGQQGQ